ncbi:MAG: glycoside hydrolase family 3 N-terminal domain-containing protein [Caldilineaceae bacterium]
MDHSLTPQQAQWVDKTLNGLSLERAIAQLFNVSRPLEDPAAWLKLQEELPFGCMSARTKSADAYQQLLTEVQKNAPIPVVVVANMEHGASEWPDYGTDFPMLMAAGAANDEALVAQLGQATALEARHLGIHWVLTPDIDLNYNFNNPVTNIRAFGDKPELVGRLGTVLIQALQAHGVAATAKHFPGDGMDDRDQHLVTSINHLPVDQWQATFGQLWRQVIEAGVWTIMPGHIALPDYQGYADNPDDAPPATICKQLLTGLLRRELGYTGLIVSDSTSMVGLTSRAAPGERIVRSLAAGIDLYLGADPARDFAAVLQAVRMGRLTEEQIYASARRVLTLKAQLHLHENPFGSAPTSEQSAGFAQASQALADQSVTVLRGPEQVPVRLAPGAKVLTVTIAKLNPMFGQKDLETFDAELQQRGFAVEHLLNPKTVELQEAAQRADAVFVNVYVSPMTTLGTARVTLDHFGTWGWRALFTEHPHVYYTTFGSPYLLYEVPHLPNLLATFSGGDVSQRAAVKVWLGELAAQGVLPVTLPKIRIKPLAD